MIQKFNSSIRISNAESVLYTVTRGDGYYDFRCESLYRKVKIQTLKINLSITTI